MFTPQEKQIIEYGVQNGKSESEVRQALLNHRTGIKNAPLDAVKKRPTALQEAGQFAMGFGKGLLQDSIGLTRLMQTAGQGIIAAADPTRTFAEVKGEMGFKSLQGEQAQAIDEVLEVKNQNEAIGRSAATAAEVLAFGGADLIKLGSMKALQTVRPLTQAFTEKVLPKFTSVAEKPTEKIIGEVIQGKTKDIKSAVTAFQNIDTQGVKTYKELSTRITDRIGSLSDVVDAELAKDTTRYTLGQLTTKTTTTGGQTVERNFVDTALKNLEELYAKTADDKALAEIRELIAQAESKGLTRLEVNDLSRVYNQEFGQKAFSKVSGEPLTSVNAQAYENIRKGLKDIAREGIGGDAAKEADSIISSLYNTRTLINKNVEAVNRLEQKISERGLFEKIGYTVAKYFDILTGGSIRGIVGGVLPRGAGYKTMNALDLEQRLQKNLDLLNKALNSKSDKTMLNTVKELEQSIKPTKVNKQSDGELLGAVGGAQVDENGNITFSPVGAAAGLVGVRVGGKLFKRIDEPTKKEMIELIDYLRINKGNPKKMERVFDALTQKYNINPHWSNSKISNVLENLVEKTDTR